MVIPGFLEPHAWAMVGALGISADGRMWGAFLGTLCPWARLSENRPEPSKEQDARDSSAWAEPEGLWPQALPLPRETLGRISISDQPKFLKAGPGCPVPPSLTQGGGRTGRIPYRTSLIKDLEVREVESHQTQYLLALVRYSSSNRPSRLSCLLSGLSQILGKSWSQVVSWHL